MKIKISTVLGLCGVLAVFHAAQAAPAPQQQQGEKIIKVVKVKDNFYVLENGGGNTSVFITKDHGVVVVDTKLPGWGPLLVEKIKSLTDKPVSTIINTHTHPDHTSGNPAFGPGVEIIAQENTAANMAKMDFYKKPENAKFLPTKTYKDKLKLFSGPDEVDLYYFGPDGTNGDTWVVFPALRIMASGDAFAGKSVNAIDSSNGGNAVAFLKTLDGVNSKIKNVDTIVAGHTDDLLTWNDFKEFDAFEHEWVAWVQMEKKAGKTVDQTLAEFKFPEKYSSFRPPNPALFKGTIQNVYDNSK